MSMGTAPCSGYVLPINEENIKTLFDMGQKQAIYDQIMGARGEIAA